MKIIRSRASRSAMTLLELVVVVVLAVIVIGLFYPGEVSHVGSRSLQTKALSNAKQIALALKLYAEDHDGVFPSTTLKDGKPTTMPVLDSNTAFAQLFPTYIPYEEVFWQSRSRFCSTNPPDNSYDDPPLDIPYKTLKKGENEWAYVVGLTEKSNPKAPLMANGFASPELHTYSRDPNEKGGVWKGTAAIVIRVDASGTVEHVNLATMTVTGSNGAGSTGDIFTTANGDKGWLSRENAVVNPK